MGSEQEAREAVELYGDTVRRICMLHLKSYHDTEDIFQTVFLKYMLHAGGFQDREHEKAWIIRVTLNACRDFLRSFFRSRRVSLDEIAELPQPEKEDYREVWEAVLSLPQKYRDVVYLHYYEDYTAPEIGVLLRKNTNTVYTWLARAREMLKEKLGGEADGKSNS